jgi:hypothetical protein
MVSLPKVVIVLAARQCMPQVFALLQPGFASRVAHGEFIPFMEFYTRIRN